MSESPTHSSCMLELQGKVLATDAEPNNGGTSSSPFSLTLPECLKNVSVKIDCHPEHYTIFCPSEFIFMLDYYQ
ncbi:unnamed protein product [Boreogadus saida]